MAFSRGHTVTSQRKGKLAAPVIMKGTDGMETESNSKQERQSTHLTRFKLDASEENRLRLGSGISKAHPSTSRYAHWKYTDPFESANITQMYPTDINEKHSQDNPIHRPWSSPILRNRISVSSGDCVELESCIGMYPTSQLEIRSSTILVRSARPKQIHSKAKTPIEVIRISADHRDSEIDLQELLTLLSETCPEVRSLEVEVGQCILGDLHPDQVKIMKPPLLKYMQITVRKEMPSEEQRLNLAKMIWPQPTDGTTVRWHSRNNTWGNIGPFGGSLHVESYGFTLNIPKGVLKKETYLSIGVLPDVPRNARLKLKKKDMIISYGFKCTPAGLKFEKPVTIRLPHCAILSAKNMDNVVLYWAENDQDFVRMPIGQASELATCDLKEEEIEIHLNHFCSGFAAQEDPAGKRLTLLSFIPDKMPKNRKPILRVYLFDKQKGYQDEVRRLEIRKGNREVDSEETLDIRSGVKDLSIDCRLLHGKPHKPERRVIDGAVLRSLDKRKETFELNLERCPVSINFELSLLLKETDNRKLIYPTGYQSEGNDTFDDNDDHNDDDGNHGGPSATQRGRKSNRKRKHNDVCQAGPSSESSPSKTESSPRRSKRIWNRGNNNDPLTDADIDSLSEKLPGNSYDKLAIQLFPDWGYNKGRNIKEGQTAAAAYRDLLHSWKNATQNTTRGMLDDILKKCGLSGLVGKYYSE